MRWIHIVDFAFVIGSVAALQVVARCVPGGAFGEYDDEGSRAQLSGADPREKTCHMTTTKPA